MKLLNSKDCELPLDGGNVYKFTMIVEEQGIVFWTRVQLPSSPAKKVLNFKAFLFFVSHFVSYIFKIIEQSNLRYISLVISL